MGAFQFVIILVLIVTLADAGVKIMVPLAGRLADLIGEMAADRRAQREGLGGPGMDAATLEQLEERLARIEDRLDFIEELRAPAARAAIDAGRSADVTAGR